MNADEIEAGAVTRAVYAELRRNPRGVTLLELDDALPEVGCAALVAALGRLAREKLAKLDEETGRIFALEPGRRVA